jgi:thymidylate synthase (FAD)
MKIVEPSVELLFITPDAEKLIEQAGRTCYKSEDKITSDSAKKFVEMVTNRGHHSVIEHAVATFKIICDRGVTHELVRHRLASYSQESTRYCNYRKNKFDGQIAVIMPLDGVLTEEQVKRRQKLYEHIEKVYMAEIEEKVPAQWARDNLPTCLKTEIVMTANFREWLHVIKLRTSEQAHPQIRQIARKVETILRRECPAVFHVLGPWKE